MKFEIDELSWDMGTWDCELFVGSTCERSVCANNPCQFGATCVPFPGSGFLCLCSLGKHGIFCENGIVLLKNNLFRGAPMATETRGRTAAPSVFPVTTRYYEGTQGSLVMPFLIAGWCKDTSALVVCWKTKYSSLLVVILDGPVPPQCVCVPTAPNNVAQLGRSGPDARMAIVSNMFTYTIHHASIQLCSRDWNVSHHGFRTNTPDAQFDNCEFLHAARMKLLHGEIPDVYSNENYVMLFTYEVCNGVYCLEVSKALYLHLAIRVPSNDNKHPSGVDKYKWSIFNQGTNSLTSIVNLLMAVAMRRGGYATLCTWLYNQPVRRFECLITPLSTTWSQYRRCYVSTVPAGHVTGILGGSSFRSDAALGPYAAPTLVLSFAVTAVGGMRLGENNRLYLSCECFQKENVTQNTRIVRSEQLKVNIAYSKKYGNSLTSAVKAENSKGDGEASVRASYAIAELISKNWKCYSDSEFRGDDIVRNLNEQLLVKVESFVAFSIAVDESTAVSGKAQLSVFICAFNLPLSKLECVATDGAPSVIEKRNGFIARLLAKQKEVSPESLPYHAEVRWLSCFNVLERFWLLREEIRLFLEMKGESVDQLCDDNWLQDLAFMVDMTGHLNDLNLMLQGKDQLVILMYDHIKVFKLKLNLWEGQLNDAREAWPPCSPDITSPDFWLWGHINFMVYATPIDTRHELITPETFALACRNMLQCCTAELHRREPGAHGGQMTLMRSSSVAVVGDGSDFWASASGVQLLMFSPASWLTADSLFLEIHRTTGCAGIRVEWLLTDLEIGQPSFFPTVGGLASYVAYPLPAAIHRSLELRFHFTPTTMEQIALMVFVGQEGAHDSRSDHLAVSFIKGYVVLTWNLGSGNTLGIPAFLVSPTVA
ncbi:hypothetical protein PR048_023905 [Dryococelus australis]|uniref:EGF-like domain-containing protein n=1 Tax=Dryococelus australis TaxID=614101 RepID=A0ABQ9GVE4_9NEOP|nr:hypothetical protein PR048_023905 [Dryococelus australis]